MAKTRKPTTPGEILLKEFLEPANIVPNDFAKYIGITMSVMSKLLSGKNRLSIGTAHRLAKATGTSVEFWVNLQAAVDLYDAKHDAELKAVVVKIKRHPAFKK